MALHGHTTIELKNIETGETRKIEEHNIVTNGLQKILQYVPTETHPPITKLTMTKTDSVIESETAYKRAIKMMTGGVLLFDKTLDENVDNFIPPAGISTVGCGSHLEYTGSNTMAGSYNESESGELENGYRHVWDFGTSQGNGQIASVCLTTREGGCVGAGTYPWDDNYIFSKYISVKDNPDSMDQLSIRDGFAQYLSNSDGEFYFFKILYADYNDGGYILTLKDSTEWVNSLNITPTDEEFKKSFLYKRAITISKRRLFLSDFSIFDKNVKNRYSGQSIGNDDNKYGTRILDEITVEMPDTLKTVMDNYTTKSGYFHIDCSSDEGFIYILIYKDMSRTNKTSQMPLNDNFHIWKINVSDFSSEHIQLTNTTGEKVIVSESIIKYRQFFITNEYVLLISVAGNIYLMNLYNSTDISPVLYPDGTQAKFSSTSLSNSFKYSYYVKGKIYFCLDHPMVLDTITKEVRYRNKHIKSETFNIDCSVDDKLGLTHYVQHSNGFIIGEFYSYTKGTNPRPHDWEIALATLSEILITINNLETPVTKTPAETMKVTYTITMSND